MAVPVVVVAVVIVIIVFIFLLHANIIKFTVNEKIVRFFFFCYALSKWNIYFSLLSFSFLIA